jgi:hypothetical protein
MNIRLQPAERARLVELAARCGVSAEDLVREIIGRYLEEHPTSMLEPPSGERGGLGTEIAAIFSKHGLDSPIPELRFAVQNPFEADDMEKSAGRRRTDSRGRLSPHESASPKVPRGRGKKRA